VFACNGNKTGGLSANTIQKGVAKSRDTVGEEVGGGAAEKRLFRQEKKQKKPNENKRKIEWTHGSKIRICKERSREAKGPNKKEDASMTKAWGQSTKKGCGSELGLSKKSSGETRAKEPKRWGDGERGHLVAY